MIVLVTFAAIGTFVGAAFGVHSTPAGDNPLALGTTLGAIGHIAGLALGALINVVRGR